MENNLEQENYNRYRWVILTFMFLCFLFTFMTRFTWPPLIPVVVPVLGISMTQAGALMSAFYFGYIMTQIPAGILVDRFGVRWILAGSLIIEGTTTFGMGFMESYSVGFGLRLVGGLGAGAVMSACARSIMEWFPAKERGTAFGILFAAPSGGIILANYVIPALNVSFGWQGAFKIVGLATVALGIVVYCAVKSSGQGKKGEGSIFGGLKTIVANKNIMTVAMAGFCLMWLELGTASWANAYIRKLGYTLADAGYVMILYGIGGVIAPIVSGLISDKVGNRKYLLICFYILVIPLAVLFGYQTTLPMLALVGFLFGFASYLSNPQLNVLVAEYAGKELAATATGFANFIFQMASMIGPLVIGWSIDFSGSFNTIWWIMAVGPLIGIFLLLAIGKNPSSQDS